MKRRAKNEPGYLSGFCAHSGLHMKCRTVLCTCPCHKAQQQMPLQETRRGT